MKPTSDSPLVFSPGLMLRPTAWVLLAIPVPLMVLACVLDNRVNNTGKWSMPAVLIALALVAMLWVTRYVFDTSRQVIVRQVGWGPILWSRETPFSAVHDLEFVGFNSRYGTAYYTVTLIFGRPLRRRRILLETDAHRTMNRAQELAAHLGVPLLSAD